MLNSRSLAKCTVRVCAAMLVGVLLAVVAPGALGTQSVAYANQHGNFTYEVVNGNAEITDYNGKDTNLIIPSTIDDYPVTSIGDKAFAYLPFDEEFDFGDPDEPNYFTSVTIPASVTHIGRSAFYNNSDLKTVTFKGTKKRVVESLAFCYCGLTQVTIPKGMVFSKGSGGYVQNPFAANPIKKFKVSGNTAFKVIDNGRLLVNAAGTKVFAFAIKSVSGAYTIPSSVKTIGSYAFYNAEMTSLNVGSGVESIGYDAFSHCQVLERVKLGKNVKTLNPRSFYVCVHLKSFVIPAGAKLTTIKQEGIYCCYNLKSIYIPASVKTIGAYAIGYDLDFGSDTEEPIYVYDFCMTVTKNSRAHKYAVEEGLNYVGPTKVAKYSWKGKSLTVVAANALFVSKNKNAYKYQFAYRAKGAKTWKYIKAKTNRITIKNLKPAVRYQVKVRAMKSHHGEMGYGIWSPIKLTKAVSTQALTAGRK